MPILLDLNFTRIHYFLGTKLNTLHKWHFFQPSLSMYFIYNVYNILYIERAYEFSVVKLFKFYKFFHPFINQSKRFLSHPRALCLTFRSEEDEDVCCAARASLASKVASSAEAKPSLPSEKCTEEDCWLLTLWGKTVGER